MHFLRAPTCPVSPFDVVKRRRDGRVPKAANLANRFFLQPSSFSEV